jgi:hypothetical protein
MVLVKPVVMRGRAAATALGVYELAMDGSRLLAEAHQADQDMEVAPDLVCTVS